MKTTKLSAALIVPFVEPFDDYHDINSELLSYKKCGFENLKAKEVGFDGLYWGLFYVNKMPSKLEIDKMLKVCGYDPED